MTILHGFELLQDRNILELNTRARYWRHIRTGAELLSLENQDENKVFSITFRTPPANSTGIAHIMEHSVLCGSDKYPVREPFVELMKGSLNTFLNAFTFPDKTSYPVASTNLKDFYNLIDVYLDAVFHPLNTQFTLYQEGWHYELENPEDPLAFKGIVFNEMKGAYSNPDSVLTEESQHLLFPDNTYNLDSGGNPAVIPDLTYQQFQDFHQTFYHPSNSRIFFYGDDDPDMRLKRMDEELSRFEKIEVNSRVSLQKQFKEPQSKVAAFDSGDDPEAKAQVSVNWMLEEAGDVELDLGLSILQHILIGTPASKLRKVLIESGLGEDLTGVGYEENYRQRIFSTGLKGVEVAQTSKVEPLILETLAHMVKDGIDAEAIAAAMNTIEFQLRENNTGAFPRGLVLLLRSLTSWLYEKDPIEPLAFETPLNAIKARLASGEKYFENLIQHYLIDNTHRLSVILQPDAQLGQKRAAAERERLDKAKVEMTADQIQQIITTTRDLKHRQETPDTPEALATIPVLQRSDLDKHGKNIPSEVISEGDAKILFHDIFTNGITYLDLGFNLHTLPQEWLPYLPIFSRALLETGTDKLDFVGMLQKIGQKTGGIHPTTLTSAVRNSEQGVAWLFLRGKAMHSQTGDLLDILYEVLSSARLDNQERIRQIAMEEKAGLESNMVEMGHRVINGRLRARFNEADMASEQMGGVSQLFFIRDLIKKMDQNWPEIQQTLESIRSTLLRQGAMLCNLTLDQAGFDSIRKPIHEFLAKFPQGSTASTQWKLAELPKAEGLTLPAQVNYVGKGINLYNSGYQMHGSAIAILPYLRNTWLWEKIRVQGGAYGGFCVFDRQSGVFNFLSYRDPNLQSSLDIYDQTSQFLQNLELSDAELTKAIITAIGEIDDYQLPDAKGYTSLIRYLVGISDEERQQIREQVLSTTINNFRQLGKALESIKTEGAVVILGSADAITASNLEKGDWLTVTKVL